MAGINPGDEVFIEAHPGEFIIRKIYSVEEALSMPKISKGTPESLEKDIQEEIKRQEDLTNEEH